MHKPRLTILTLFVLLLVNNVSGQITFSNIDVQLKTVRNSNVTGLVCTGPSFSFEFGLGQRSIQLKDNFAQIDSQVIQITPLQVSGYEKVPGTLDSVQRRLFLETYSQYELDYFKNDLNLEIINPNNQWVITKSGGWLVWYFRVGKLPVEVKGKIEFQLFASTIIADKVLTINAPIQNGGDFTKAALIVNDMMESLKTGK